MNFTIFTDYLLDEEKSAVPRRSTDPARREIVHTNTSVHIIDFRRRKSYQICRIRPAVQ